MKRASPRGGPFLLATSGLLSQLTLSPAALADGATPNAELVDSFVYVPGESGEVGCLPLASAKEPLLAVAERALTAVGIDPDFVVLLTARVLTCPSIFYLPVKNDTLGIGYQRRHAPEIFDDAEGRRLSGIAFLNDLPYWQTEPEELSSAFLHEVGHRWLASVHAQKDGQDIDLTGRDGEHWSYFLDTGGSPLEGNAWQDEDEPISESPLFPLRYSALDLYLMGAYAEDEVPPFRLLVPDESEAVDCTGAPLHAASPPQTCEPLELAGTWLPLTLDDVIAAEGPRVPAHAEASKSFEVAFVLLDPGGAGFGVAECQDLSLAVDGLIELFAEATDGRLNLVNAATGGRPCDEVEFAQPASGGCQLHPASTHKPAGPLLLLAALAALRALPARVRRLQPRRLG